MLENKKTKDIYLDYAATTPVDSRVLDVMHSILLSEFGNASSMHTYGTKAKEILELSRKKIADCLNASPEEIFFTSGGTESNNWALKGMAWANKHKGNHILISAIEHESILNSCKWLIENGFRVSLIPVDINGLVDPDFLKKAITQQTILVSVMHANNEIGTIEPVDEIADICHFYEVPFHSDACQSFGKLDINVKKTFFSLLTFNAHKIYGPKGTGALFIRKGTKIEKLVHGGGQEKGMRSTTENIAGIAGFAEATALCINELFDEQNRLKILRNYLTLKLKESFSNLYINGHTEQRLPGNLNFSFHGFEGETIKLLLTLDDLGIAVSTGSACSSNHENSNASHVLKAIGLNPLEARGAIRVSLGRYTKKSELDTFFYNLKSTYQRLNPIFNEFKL